ncbi:MAG TPA: TIM barrel protein [Candidatus Sulfotelmatobacter sp.]|nr:TIM barrel protein [Candidatus Sulfotelmatobacter sp.]
MGLRFDVSLSILFTELPLLERPAAAAAAGFDAVELWWPFAEPIPPDKDLAALKRALDDAGTQLVGLNFDAGDMAGGWRGLVSLPDQSDRFRANIPVAIGFAEDTGCRVLNALYGNRAEGVEAASQDDVAVENLTLAAEAANKVGATVVVEALNAHENPRYPLTSSASAMKVVEGLRSRGAKNVALLCDVYHLARMEEDPVAVIRRYGDRIGHVQVADVPGRHQPGTGGIDFPGVFSELNRIGYRGYIGCEYRPLGPSAESFKWLDRVRAASERTSR